MDNLERPAAGWRRSRASGCRRGTALLGGRWTYVGAAWTVHEFDELARAFSNARRACQTARECAGPILAELTAI